MKKIIFFLILFCLFLSPIKAITPSVEYRENIYSNRVSDSNIYSGKMGFIVVNNRVIFCLDPYSLIGGDYTINNNYFSNYPSDVLDYIKVISNYVNDDIQGRNMDYYMAAQELIWEKLTGKDVYYTTQINGAGSIIDIDYAKNQILDYTNNFFKKPSFNGTIVRDNFFKTIKIEDSNNLLRYYDVYDDGKNLAWKEDNDLYIKIMSSSLSEIKMIRASGSGEAIYYYSPSNQDLARLYSHVQTEANIYVQANNKYNTNITFNFLDSETEELVTDTINFSIDKKDTAEKTDYTTSNGIYIKDLEEGSYELIVNSVPYGYLIPDNNSFIITEADRLENRTINIYLDKPKGKLNFKACEKGNFELYDSDNNLIEKFKENSQEDLKLGKYYVVDVDNNQKYDFEITYKDAYTKIVVYDLDICQTNDILEDINSNDQEDDNNIELPNTFDYMKIVKIALVLLLVIGIVLSVKTKEK